MRVLMLFVVLTCAIVSGVVRAAPIDTFLERCPTTDEMITIRQDFNIYFDNAVFAPPNDTWNCTEGGSESSVMLTVYNAFRVMKYIDFTRDIPILNTRNLYKWLRYYKPNIHVFAGGPGDMSYATYDTIHINGYWLGTPDKRYWRHPQYGTGIADTIALMLHEARHTDPGGGVVHDCANGNDSSLAIQGAWAVQHYYWQWLSSYSGHRVIGFGFLPVLSRYYRDEASYSAQDILNTKIGCN